MLPHRLRGTLALLLLAGLLASAIAPCANQLSQTCACGKSKRSCCCKLLGGKGSFCVKMPGGGSCGISGTDTTTREPTPSTWARLLSAVPAPAVAVARFSAPPSAVVLVSPCLPPDPPPPRSFVV